MSHETRQKAEYTKIRKEILKLLEDPNFHQHFVDDPKFEAISDTVRKNRMSYSEAVSLYKQTYPDEG